ncbi:MAG: hypothetical protein K0S41_1559 [Anaerocolumna sp.]|nr:hypothetical protein [Anaerocolumna sp.]
MDFLDKNLNIIMQAREFLFSKLQECNLDNLVDENIYINTAITKDNNLTSIVVKDNKSYRLNSLYNPRVEAEKWASQFYYNNLNIVVCMFGFGNGIFAREIMKCLGDRDMLFILEPSIDIFMHTLQNYDITDILSEGRVSISVENINQVEFTTLLNQCITWTNLSSQIKCMHPHYDKLFTDRYNNFMETLKNTEIRTIVNKNTESYWGSIMVKNEIRNLKHLKDSNILSDYVDIIPNDVPAIVVSAGPSLDKNIDQISKAKGKSVIFSTDTALKYLLKHDIIPDFVVTLDATKSMDHFQSENFKKIPLLCKSTSNPEVLNLHKGKKILFSNDGYISAIYNSLGKTQIYNNVGGCVSTAAFSICVSLGFNRIVLMGQDLCYSGNITHAGGTISNAHDAEKGAMTMVEDIYGNMVKARYDWYTYLLWFQDAIEAYPDIDVINATEGGAKIKGARVMTLEEMIQKYCDREIDIKTITNTIEPTIQSNELHSIVEYLEQSKKDLILIENKAKEALVACNKLALAAKKETVYSYVNQDLIRKISKINKEIAKMNIYQLINDYIAHVTTKELDTINQFTDDIKNDQIKTYLKPSEIYKAIVEAVDVMKPLLEKAITEI